MRPRHKLDVCVPAVCEHAWGSLGIIVATIGRFSLRSGRLRFLPCRDCTLRCRNGLTGGLLGVSRTAAVTDDLPELLHLRARHDLVARTAEHKNTHIRWELRCLDNIVRRQGNKRKKGGYLEVGLPLFVAEEGERAEQRHRGWDEPR